VTAVRGALELRDGSREELDAAALRVAPETALRWVSFALPVLAVALVLARA
jgi:hypothetical protein